MNVSPVFIARGIDRPTAFLRKNGFTSTTANDIVMGKVKVLNLKRLEELCLLLNCLPHDLLEWKPDEKLNEPNKFELYKLSKERKTVVLSEELRKLPLEKVEEIYRFVDEKKKEVDG